MTSDDPPADGGDRESTDDDRSDAESPAESAERPKSKGRSQSEDRTDAESESGPESEPDAGSGPDAESESDVESGSAVDDRVGAGESAASGGGSPVAGDDRPTVERDTAGGDPADGAGQGAGRADEPLGGLRDRVIEDDDGERSRPRSSSRDGPLGDVASEIDERRERPSPSDDELFEEMDIDEVDSDALWEQVESEEPVEPSRRSREIREVDKHKYCKRCPHFSEPPTVECTLEGTEIVEQVDMETFTVADCPVILEDERLEKVTTD